MKLSTRPSAMVGLFSAAFALTAVVAATLLFALPASAAITNTTFTLEIRDITKTSATLRATRPTAGGLYVQWREAGTTTWTQAQSESAATANTDYDSALTLTDKTKYEVEVASDSAYTSDVLTATFWSRPNDKDWTIADNTEPWGIAADSSTVWVGDPSAEDVKAYNLTGKTRDSDKDITTMLLTESSPSPFGLYAEGSILWVSVNQTTSRAFDNSGTTPTRSNTNELNDTALDDADNANMSGLWASADYFYVADTFDDKLFAYDRTSKAHAPTADIALRDGNVDPLGIWSDGTIIWVADFRDAYIYAYVLATGARYPESDIQLEHANDNPHGLWSPDGEVLWVVDNDDTKVYAYYLPPSPLFGELTGFRIAQLTKTSANVFVDIGADSDVHFRWREAGTETWTTGEPSPADTSSTKYSLTLTDRTKYEVEAAADRDFTVSKIEDVFETRPDDQDWTIAGIGAPWGIADDGTTVWVSDSMDKDILAYNLSDKMSASGKDISEANIHAGTPFSSADPYGLYSDGSHLWVVDSEMTSDTLVAFDLSGTAPARSASNSLHLGTLNTFAGDSGGVWASDGYFYVLDQVDGIIYAYDRSNSNTRDSSAEITLHADNANAHGIWSNGTIMWVADTFDDKLFAYNLSDGARDAESDIRLGHDTSQTAAGLWSPDGDVLWVVDSVDEVVYAYYLPQPEEPSTPIVLVKNTGQSDDGADISLASNFPRQAQAFTTGSNSGGYHLTSIAVRFDTIGDTSTAKGELAVTLNQVSGSNPGSALCTLENPDLTSTAANTFAAPTDGTCPILKPSTSYFVVLNRTAHSTGSIVLQLTTSDNEDTGGADGWTIGNDSKEYNGTTSSWGTTSSSRSLMIEVKGYASANNPATGAPSISGVLQQNEELTAATLGIADADGLGTFAYQWLADGTAISGATSSTYTLTADEVGKAISLTVTFTDGEDFSESLTSAATHNVVASGATRRLLWLGTLTPTDRSGGTVGTNVFTQQGTLIPHSFTYGSDTYGFDQMDFGPAPSSGLLIAMRPVPGADEEEGWIFDTGREWAVSDASVNNDGTQIFMNWSAAAGDVDWTIGMESVVYLLEEVNAPPTGAPAITGTPRVGEELTADTSAIMDPNGLTTPGYSYQWVRVNGNTTTNIGTDSSTYTLVDADADKQIRVDVTFTDDGSTTEEPLSSELSATIVPDDVLVRNTGQTRDSSGEDFDRLSPDAIGQAFTTGAHANGYNLDSIGVHFFNTGLNFSASTLTATLNADGSGEPGAALCTLTRPATFDSDGLNTFAVPETGTTCPTLDANTTYWFVVVNTGVIARLSVTESDDEDPGGAAGWSISNIHGQRQGPASSNAGDWIEFHGHSIIIEVKGAPSDNNRATGAPTVTGTPRVGEVLTADASAIMDADGLGTFAYQWVRVDGDSETNIGTDASTYTLVDADADNRIRVEVSFTDGEGNAERPLSSAVTDTIAPSDLLVRNTGQTSFPNALSLSNDGPKLGQAFTTGPEVAGYVLGSIGFKLKEIASTGTAGAQLQVTLNEVGRNGHPGTALCTLTDPAVFTGSGVQTFHAMTTDSCPTLAASTTYFAVIERVVTPTPITVVSVPLTGSHDQHSASATGWSIGDDNRFIASGSWSTGTAGPIQIEVRGEVSDQFEVPADWSLIPTGLTSGDTFRLLFVTELGHSPTSSEIADYNAYVQAQAAAGHTDIQDYSGWFRVLGSTATTAARDNTETTYTATNKGVPIYWLNGSKVADEYEDFYDQSWDNETDPRNRAGATIAADHVWTGSHYDGRKSDVTPGVSAGLGESLVRLGILNDGTHSPLHSTTGGDPNVVDYPYYALSGVFVVAAASDPTKRVTAFELHSSQTDPRGIWGNDDTFWVVRDQSGNGAGDKLYAYNRADGSRNTTADFDNLNGAGNNRPWGVCSDGTHMYVGDRDDNKLYAYLLSDTTHVSGEDITLDSDNAAPRGMWCDSTYVYVANDGSTTGNKVFAYKISDGSHDTSKDFESLYDSTDAAASAETPRGIWSNGTTMFVADSADDAVFPYKHSDESLDSAKGIVLDSAINPQGMWFDGRVLWVVDDTNDRLYAYNLPGANPDNTPAEGAPAIRSTFSRDVFRATVRTARASGNFMGSTFSLSGYTVASASPSGNALGSISESEFTFNGETYTVSAVYDGNRNNNDGDLILELDKALPRGFTFTADGVTYSSDDATESEPGTSRYRYWWSASLSWGHNDSIPVVLSIETPKDGEEVTADPSGITDDTNGVASASFHYEWIRVDGTDETETEIGAVGARYTPTADDVGNYLKVRAVFNDDAGNQEYPITGPRFGPVVDAVPPTLVSAVANTADTIVLTFDEALDPISIPTLAGGFSVEQTASHNMETANVPLDGVVAHPEDAEKIVLTVHTVLSRDAFTVTYTKTGKLLQDLNRNEVEPFAGVAVTNEFQDTFVSNLGQTAATALGDLPNEDVAQQFHTGSTASFDFTEIEVVFSTVPSSTATLTAYIADGLTINDNIVVTLTNPDTWSTNAKFGIPEGTTLAANTEYYLIIESDEGQLQTTANNAEDAGSAPNWTIGDGVAIRIMETDSNLGGTWNTSPVTSLQIAIRGLHHGRPGTPTLEVTGKDQGLVLVVTVPDHGSSDLTDMEARYKETTGGTYTGWTSVPGTISNSGGTFEIGGLDNGTDYTVQVQTVNNIGTSDASNEDSATPDSPPVITSVAITSDPGADKTYDIGDEIAVTVTFDKNITLSTGTGSVPNIIVEIGSVGFRLDCPEPTPPTMKLVCAGVIGEDEGQDSDGISVVRNSFFSGDRMIVGPLGQPAVVTFDALDDDADHKVDAVRPTLTGARTSDDLDKIILTFSEAIGSADRTKMTFMSGTTAVTTTADSISGAEVEITLTTALTAMDTSVTVALAADAVTDAVGNGNAVLAATPVRLANQIWSATLTVKDLGSSFLGCDTSENSKGCEPGELLTDNDFSYDSVDYQIDVIDLKSGTLQLEANIAFTAASLADLTLNVGSDSSFAFEDATHASGLLTWTTTGLTWSEDDMIALSIDADPPPMLVTATATTPTTIVLTFDELLDATSVPAASAFSVQSTALLNGATTAITVDSVGVNADDGTQLVLTVATMLYRDTITVSYTEPSDNPLQDAQDNVVVSFTGQAVVNEFLDTIVSNLGETTDTSTGDLDTDDFAQRFDTGSTASFDFTEVEVLFDTLPSDTSTVTAIIADGLGSGSNVVATLTNPSTWSVNATFGIPDGTTLAKNTTYYLIIEAGDGEVASTISTAEDSGAAANWTIGDNASIRADETLSGVGGTWTGAGVASLKIAIRGKHHGRPGTPELTLTAKDETLILEVTVPDHGSFDLTRIEYRSKTTGGNYSSWRSVDGPVTNEGGTFEIGATNGTEYTIQVQTVNAIGASDASSEESATPDAPPKITLVNTRTTPGTDGAYEIGDPIWVAFTFDKDITISGAGDAPTITLRIGTVNKKVDCEVDVSTPRELDCRYTVVEGDLDTDGINLPVLSISDPDDRIVGPLGQPAVLTYISGQIGQNVDGVRPTLTGARASNDKTKIILTFSENIGAVDRAKMTFMSGTTAVTTTADSISGSEVEITLTNALTDSDTNVTVALAADAVEDAVGNGNAELAATPVKVVEEIWSATLTVKDIGPTFLGCTSALSNKGCEPGELLTDNDFSYDGTAYEVREIDFKVGGIEDGRLSFKVDENLTAATKRDLTLNVGSVSFPFADASGTSLLLIWNNSGLNWSEDDMIALSIDADPPPMVETAQVATATTINLIFDQGLDSSSLPAATAFAVTVNGNANSVSSAAFNTAGDGVILTVGTAMVAWDRVEVTYTPPSDNPLKDAAGNETEEFTVELENLLRDTLVSNLGQTAANIDFNLASTDVSQTFTTGPAVDAYTLTGIKVKFDTVPTATATVSAFIADGRTATDSIVANLTNPDSWSSTSTFGIPSGTTLAANTTYYLIIEGSDGRLNQTSSNNEDAGAVTGWSISDTSGARGQATTGLGGTWTSIARSMQMSVEGIHKGIPGIPALTLAAKDQAIVMEVEISEHGREDLTDIEYRYKATASGTYTEWASFTSFTNAGGTHEITGLTNSTVYFVQVQGVNDSGDGLPSDEETATPDAPPAITSVVITSDPGMDKTYDIGDEIVVTVTFDKNISLVDTRGDTSPFIEFLIGTAGKEVPCAVGTAPTMVMTCTYTVEENAEDTDGIAVGANSITLRRQDIVGPLGQNAVITHSALAADSDHKVDGVRPKFTGARASADNTKITLTFSEAIGAVDSTKITFDSGGTTLTHTSAMRSGSEVVVTLTNPLTATDTMVTVALAAAAVYDAVGNGNAVLAATRIVDETAPALSTATTPSETEVLLTYNEPLDGDSIPAASAFSVTANPSLALDVWSGTLTVQDTGDGFLGCNSTPGFPAGDKCSTSTTLTDYTFSYDGRDYEITNIELKDGTLDLITDRFITPAAGRDLTLHVGATRLAFSDAPVTGVLRRWTGTGLTWSEGQVVTLSIDRGTSRTVSTAALSGTSAIKLTVSPAFRPGDALTVSYTVPDSNPIKDASANEAAALVNQAVDNTLPATAPDPVVSMTAENTSTFGKVDLTWDGNTWPNGSAITKHQVQYFTPFWDGTLTVKEYTVGGNNLLGCDSAEANVGCTPSEQLNDNTFSYDSVDYVIGRLFVHGGSLTLGTTGTALGATALTDLALRVGDRLFPLADAASAVTALTWANTGISWSENDTVQLSIGTLSAWTDVPDSAPGEANATSHTLEGLALGGLNTFQVRAVNDGGGGEASFNLTLLAPAWSFVLRDSDLNDVTELTEGGDSAIAVVLITNSDQATFDTEQEITLEWNGISLDQNNTIQGAGTTSTISIPAGGSSGSLVISAPNVEPTPVYFPFTADLTATWEDTVIGTIENLRRIEDEDPPVARITDAPESVNEGDSFDIDIELSIGYPSAGDIKFTIADGDSALSGTLPTETRLSASQLTAKVTLSAAENMVMNDGTSTVTFTLLTSDEIPYTLGTGEEKTVTIIVRDDDTPPSAPRNLVARAGNTEATLVWDAPAAGTPDHGQPILHYEYRVKAGMGSFGNWTMVPNSDGTTTSHKFTGLTNGTLYTYELRAENVAGDGAVDDVTVTPRVGVPVTFGAATASVTEGGTVDVTVTLDEAPAAGVTVVVPITATAGTGLGTTEYTGVPENVTFNAGDTSKSFTVTAVQDTIVEEDEELTLTLGTLPTGYVTGTNSSVVITVEANDEPEWALTLTDSNGLSITEITEGEPDFIATMRITNGVTFDSDQTLKFTWQQDIYDVTLADGETSASVTLPGFSDDNTYWPNREVTVFVVFNGSLIATTHLTAVDDEEPPVLNLSLSKTRIVEGETVSLQATLNRGYTGVRTETVANVSGATTKFAAGTFGSGNDTASLNFNPGVTGGLSLRLTYTSIDGSTAGDHGEVVFTIPTDNPLYTAGTPSTATLLILDDDDAPGAPRNISARPGDAEAALRWTRPANYDQVWVSDYQYRQRAGTDPWTSWAVIPGSDAETTRHTFTGLTNRTEYTFEVRARNSNNNGAAVQVMVTPSPRPPTTVSITASVSEPVRAPFRVTITFTDQDMDGMDTDGIEGFEADDIIAYYTTENHGSYEFRVTDFREETPGKEYSALVDQIIDGKLWIEVEEGAAQSKLDGAVNAGSYTTWQVDAPALPSAPEGETIWSDNLRIGGEDIRGYFVDWSSVTGRDERFGELPNGNFSYNGTDYEIEELIYTNTWRALEFAICPTLEGANSNFWLHLGEDSKAVSSGGDYISTRDFTRTRDGTQLQCTRYRWNPIELNWPKGQGRNVKITVTEGEVEERPVVASVALTSNPNNDGRPGSDSTYAIGDSVTATVTFDKAVDVTGLSQITLLFGTAEKAAACAAATNTRTMACTYQVAAGDTAPTGVGIKANTLLLDGGTIYATGSVTTRANLAHQGLGLQSGHKVDGIRPTLITTGSDAPRTFSDGIRIQLTFNENIEEATPSLFTIESNSVELPLSSQVSINARTVVLRLATALTDSTASLTVALDAEAVEDVFGNTNQARSAVTLMNNVGVAPTGPDAPTGLTATPAPDVAPQLAVTLDWTAPASDGGSAITYHQYRYSRNSGEFGSWTRIPNSSATDENATSFTVRGLSAVDNMFTTFEFQVRAVNANANGSESVQASTFITVPTNLQTVDVTPGNHNIELSWDSPANNGSAILRYEYALTETVSGATVVSLGTRVPGSNADTTSFTITGLTNGVNYTIRLRAVNSVGPAGTWDSQPIIPATFPTAPRNLRAEPGDTQVTLRWTAPLSDGGKVIDEYQYQQKTGNSAYGSWTTITGSDDTTTGHDVTGLTNGTSYSFKVRAKNSVGEGPESNEVTVVPVTGPSAPTSLTATPAPDETPQLAIALSWTAPTDDGGSAIRSHQYRYSRNNGSFGSWTPIPNSSATGANATSFTVKGLSAVDNTYTTFEFQVRAVNANANGSESGTASTFIDVPLAPLNLEGTSGDRRVELTWDTPGNNGSKILKYQYVVTDLSTNVDIIPAGTDIPGSDGNTTSFTVTGLTNGVLYDIRVNAVNSVGPGGFSLIQGAAPATFPTAPRNLRAEAGDTQITLRWTAPLSDGGYDITGYELHVSTDGTDNSYSWLTSPSASDRSYTHANLQPGTTRYYQLRARNRNGWGEFSLPASATTPPTVPAAPGLTVRANGATEIKLTWTKPDDRGSEILVYHLQESDDGNDWDSLDGSIPASDTEYVHTGLSGGTTKYYRISAANANGEGQWSTTRNARTDAGGPDAPILTLTVMGENQIDLSWTTPADNGSSIRGYWVERSVDGNEPWERQTSNNRTTEYSDSTLYRGITRHYRVAAFNGAGAGPYSETKSAMTTGDPATAPGTPTLFRLSEVGRNQVTIAWDPPADNSGAPVTGYEYEAAVPCKNAPEFNCGFTGEDIRETTGTSARITGLSTDGDYYFRVRAENLVGKGDWGTDIQATLRPSTNGQVRVSPTNITVNEGATVTYTIRLSTAPPHPVLAWIQPQGSSGYNNIGEAAFEYTQSLLVPRGWTHPDPDEAPYWTELSNDWNQGVSITFTAPEVADTEDEVAVMSHFVTPLPYDDYRPCRQETQAERDQCRQNWEAEWADSPYRILTGASVKVTVRDND